MEASRASGDVRTASPVDAIGAERAGFFDLNVTNAVRFILVLAGAVLVVRLISFIFTVGQPFAYYKDLGVNFITLSYATHDIHSWRDFLDTLGWSPWYDQPLFNLNPYLSYVVSLPLAYIFESPWFTVKVVEAVECAAAFAAMFWVCRELRYSGLWACAAGLLYTLLPATTLGIRGNLDLGWTAVGAALALAAGIALLRRFSLYALPLVGAICSLLGFCIAIEYLLFVSAPLYLVFAISAYDARRRVIWLVMACAGLVALISTGAYFLLPSLWGSLYSNSAARSVQLHTGSILPLFSETWDAFSGLVPRESLVSPVAAYNATPSLWIAEIAGSGMALFALGALIMFRKRVQAWTLEWGLVVLALVLGYLTLGTYAPFGTQVWDAIGTLPLLNAIRTPDRFIVIPALVATLWAVRGLARLSEVRSTLRWAAPIAVAVMFFCFISFDFVQHSYQNQNTIGIAEPDILAANQTVAHIGGRDVSFALANGGSPFDYPSYGVPANTAPAVGDWESRYIEDGIGAIGIMQRAGARSVIATPMWATADADGFPDTSAIYRSLPGVGIAMDAPQDVIVARLPHPRALVAAVRQACLDGGPGLLDHLLAARAFAATALRPAADGCTSSLHVLSNYSAFDALVPQEADAWVPGVALFPGKTLQDADYPFLANRILLRYPWYRDAVDGDAAIFSSAGTALVRRDAATQIPVTIARAGSYALLVHAATHAWGTIADGVDGAAAGAVPFSPALGMRWFRMPLPHLAAGTHAVSIRLRDVARTNSLNASWAGVAIDGAAIVPVNTMHALEHAPLAHAAVAVSLDRIAPPQHSGTPTLYLAPSSGGIAPLQQSGIVAGRFDGHPVYEAVASHAWLSYRYTGPGGVHQIRAVADLPRTGDTVSVSVVHAGGSIGKTQTGVGEQNRTKDVAMLDTALTAGDRIRIELDSRFPDAGDRAQLLAAAVLPAPALTVLRDGPGVGEASLHFVDLPNQPRSYAWAQRLAYNSAGASGVPGQHIDIPMKTAWPVRALAVRADVAGGGTGRLGLSCGSQHSTRSVLISGGVGLRGNLTNCRIAFSWLSGELTIQSLHVYATYANLSGSRHVWLPAGRYTYSLQSQTGVPLSDTTSTFDGNRVSGPVVVRTSGVHTIALHGAAANAYLATFVPTHWPSAVLSGVSFHRTGALRARVRVQRRTDLEVTHLSDRHWLLQSKGRTIRGRRCDLLETCFAGVPAGRYALLHVYPKALVWGFLCSLATLALCAGALLLALADRKRAELRECSLNY